jgi:hypothetical protein
LTVDDGRNKKKKRRSYTAEERRTLVKAAVIIAVVVVAVAGAVFVLMNRNSNKQDGGGGSSTVLGEQYRGGGRFEGDGGTTGEGSVSSAPTTSSAPSKKNDKTRAPLPGENKAQLVNPDGETVYQRYRGNHSDESGLTLWGDVFKNPVERNNYVGDKPAEDWKKLANERTDKALSQRAKDMISNMYTFRVQDYPHMTCAIAGYQSQWIEAPLARRLKSVCAADPNPTAGWEQLMEKDAYTKVTLLEESIQGTATGWNDTGNKTGRSYHMEIGFFDAAGNVIAEPTRLDVFTTWHKANGGWKLSDLYTNAPEAAQ